MSRRLGQNAADVLTQLSLIGGYRFGGPPDLLAATGGLIGDSTRRRLGETQKWVVELTRPGSLRPPMHGRPGGEAWRLTVHVRAMHALVNATFEPRWDSARWGLPINQADQASTLMLFDGILIIGCRGLGVRISARESRALMHLWKYVGWLMGVHPDFLVDQEWERHRQAYHVLLAQADISEAGPRLAQSIVEAQLQRRYPGWPRRLQWLRGRYEQERLLSMLTTFLGPTSMRDLGLPLRPPWAHLYIVALNTAPLPPPRTYAVGPPAPHRLGRPGQPGHPRQPLPRRGRSRRRAPHLTPREVSILAREVSGFAHEVSILVREVSQFACGASYVGRPALTPRRPTPTLRRPTPTLRRAME